MNWYMPYEGRPRPQDELLGRVGSYPPRDSPSVLTQNAELRRENARLRAQLADQQAIIAACMREE